MLLNKKIEILKQLIIKCVNNPIYFLRHYCYVVHPTRGKIKFDLYPFQLKTLTDIQNHKYNIILKSRQLGISTLMAGYSLWLMMFNKDKTIVVIANKLSVAKKLIEKVKIMYDNVPEWLKVHKLVLNNKTTLKFSNGSNILARAATEDAGRSDALSLLIWDLTAFVKGNGLDEKI